VNNEDYIVQDEEGIDSSERRIAPRLEEDNDVTITIISKEKNLPQEKINYNLCKDISESGIRIQANIFLPVHTKLHIKVILKNPPQMITTFAKVKWIKKLPTIDFYEAGLEFINTSKEMIEQLEDYILSKLY
jgi:c-di-GMP-binding flagellar brake protein YcgR